MSSVPSSLEVLLARLLDGLGNFTLQLDPLSRARLGALEDKQVRFEILPPGSAEVRPLTLAISARALHWQAAAMDRPNVIVRGPLPGIVALMVDPEASAGVEIEGDETVLGELADLLRNFEPDLAGPMGEIVGRELADSLVGLAEAGIALLKSAAEGVSNSARAGARASYLGNEDFSHLLDDLEDLRLRVDRLTARVSLAEAARTAR